MSAHIVVGAFFGDEGKGLVSAFLASKYNVDMVARAGTGSNAEHGIFLKDEKTYLKTNQLPLGFMFSSKPKIAIGSGVAVNPILLKQEMAKYHLNNRVFIDYRCPITTPEHIEREKQNSKMKGIGSTMSGTGATRADFVNRIATQAKDIPELKSLLCDIGNDINEYARNGTVIIESSQGTFLSLAVSKDYPNVTSDNVLSTSAMDDVLLNPRLLGDVYLVVKAIPTREGSGDMFADEYTEDELNNTELAEISSIEGKIRRKAKEMNWEALKYSAKINGANKIALTFLDHFDAECTNIKLYNKVTTKCRLLIGEIEDKLAIPVVLLNTGKAYDCLIDLQPNNSVDWSSIHNNVSKMSA